MYISTSRRALLRGALLTPLSALAVSSGLRSAYASDEWVNAPPDTGTGPFVLPPLPYGFEALEPHIDTQTMQIHHDKHHATYVKNLNDAAAKTPEIGTKTADELIKNLELLPAGVRMLVRNNAGGHINHSMFWALMKPGGGGEPTGPIADAVKGTFGSFDAFKTAFNDAGVKRFGSGWTWLVRNKEGKLEVRSTANQDSPILEGAYPIMGNDVWEHAYYLKYQNRRADYLKAWWNVVNWDEINRRLASAG